MKKRRHIPSADEFKERMAGDSSLRPPTDPDDAQMRNRLIERALKMKREIEIDLNTVRYWNERVRKPGEQEIDPDPHGEYAAALAWLNKLIASGVP
jgi:hypothetical protein